jgi:DDE superfamily endonuclease/Helix-turn-helix of DDE superfamily endonuclease
MNQAKLARNPRTMKALTGLSREEFEALVPTFEKALLQAASEGKDRIRAPGGGRKGSLPTPADKLFFVLFYLKTYPTFDVLGFFFNKPRGRSCEHANEYLGILKKALGRELALPKRQIRSVEEFMEAFPEVKDVFGDGTERRIERPKKPKRARKAYSGKKKAHTRKNLVVADERRRILYLSPTKSGRRHDKRMMDKMVFAERLPANVAFFGDSAFQGIQHVHPQSCIPKRGTKRHPLAEEERKENHIISSFRIVIENAIGGVKRFRSMVDRLRNRIGRFDDEAMEVCAGLWNYHLRFAAP